MAGIRERLHFLLKVWTKIVELPMDYCLHLLKSLTCCLAPLNWLIRLFKFKFRLTAGVSSHQYCMSSGNVLILRTAQNEPWERSPSFGLHLFC